MRRSVKLISIFAVVMTLSIAVLSSSVSAALLNVVGGQLMGASGVDVGGTLYDVAFKVGSCSELYDGCDSATDLPFDSSGAMTAAQALLDQVFIDGAEGLFDTNYSLTNGIEANSTLAAWIVIPYAVQASSSAFTPLYALNTWCGDGPTSCFPADMVHLDESAPLGRDVVLSGTVVMSEWKLTAVPEPTTIFLLGSGLVGLGAFRKKFKK